MKKTVYKVRHKATGLYYVPSRGCNLSEEGKIYPTKNTLLSMLFSADRKYVYCINLYVPRNGKIYKKYKDKLENCYWLDGDFITVDGNDFELVAFEMETNLKEIGTVNY